MSVRSQQIRQQVSIASITFACGGSITRAAGPRHFRVNRHNRKAGVHQCIDQQSRRTLDRHAQRFQLAQPSDQLRKTLRGALDDRPGSDNKSDWGIAVRLFAAGTGLVCNERSPTAGNRGSSACCRMPSCDAEGYAVQLQQQSVSITEQQRPESAAGVLIALGILAALVAAAKSS